MPIEIQEAQYPILVERFELMQDSGGAGRNRGGLSLRKDVRILADEMVLTNLTDRQRFHPYGLAGGCDGALGETILNPGEHEERIGSKDVRILAKDDVVSFRCSGSGGYGPPSERPHAAIERDIAEEFVSIEAAARVYGWRGAGDPA